MPRLLNKVLEAITDPEIIARYFFGSRVKTRWNRAMEQFLVEDLSRLLLD